MQRMSLCSKSSKVLAPEVNAKDLQRRLTKRWHQWIQAAYADWYMLHTVNAYTNAHRLLHAINAYRICSQSARLPDLSSG